MNWLIEQSDGTVINLRVTPRSSKNAVSGVLGDSIKIRLQAPPVDGKANKALIEFLSETLDVPRSAMSIVSGETGRTKRVLVRGMRASEIKKAMGL